MFSHRNAAPFSFFNKDRGDNIRARGKFVVNLVSDDNLQQMKEFDALDALGRAA